MTGRTKDTQNRDSLNWLAVQYVLGELAESEALAFEERLAVDQVACEAVADATRLTLALQSAVADVVTVAAPEAAPLVVRPAKTTPRGSWLALAGATTAAAGLLAAVSFGPNGSRQTQLVRVDRSTSELVSLWRAGSAATVTEADDSEVEIADTNHDVAVPNWLFAAVSLEQGKAAGNSTEEWQEN